MKISATDRQRSDVLVVFGATGDLAYKMIFPSLYRHGETRRAANARHRCRFR
ncbi:UNVERIFIED_ORG: glucose-6-phosphate 1-dehydrogenase [Rhizobium sp. SORGH_AS 755]|nr:glucose-6-phosphate 1-dehydrogenase [Rhizobium sp. SORGH_AS_0755]